MSCHSACSVYNHVILYSVSSLTASWLMENILDCCEPLLYMCVHLQVCPPFYYINLSLQYTSTVTATISSSSSPLEDGKVPFWCITPSIQFLCPVVKKKVKTPFCIDYYVWREDERFVRAFCPKHWRFVADNHEGSRQPAPPKDKGIQRPLILMSCTVQV